MNYDKVFKGILDKDPILRGIVSNTILAELDKTDTDLYLSLIEAILSQQLSIKASATIIKRFKDLFPENYPNAEILVGLSPEELRTSGVSVQKSGYLKSLAAFQIEKGIDYEKLKLMDDEAVIDYLLPIKGVGRWTVEMMLIFTLHRPDVFPIDDLAVKQKMIQAYGINETGKELKKRLHEIAAAWSPYRSIVSRYLWKWNP